VYARVTAPFDYTAGYHALMRALPARFAKPELLRIVRALAVVRPSLIALQMPLSSEDEVFVEKCFQRSLLEYEKLVGFAGTPTVAWRRTGEVVLVGPEFAMLTGWSRADLVVGGKYIWEVCAHRVRRREGPALTDAAPRSSTMRVRSSTGRTLRCTRSRTRRGAWWAAARSRSPTARACRVRSASASARTSSTSRALSSVRAAVCQWR
jgi:PAS domain-containing protein